MMIPLEFYRRTLGISQRRLARMIGRSATLISGVERGWIIPSSNFRKRCAEALGVSEKILFPEEHKLYANKRARCLI